MELLTTRHLPLFKFLSLSSILPHVTDMVLDGSHIMISLSIICFQMYHSQALWACNSFV